MDRRFKSNTVAIRRNAMQLDGKPVVVEPLVKCPHCGSADTFVNGTKTSEDGKIKLRYRICRGCGSSFVGQVKL